MQGWEVRWGNIHDFQHVKVSVDKGLEFHNIC